MKIKIMEAKDYKIVPYKKRRFAIADLDGKVIDSAQGYGYKSKEKAVASYNWRVNGGKEKAEKQKSDFKNWLNENPLHKQILKQFNGYLESCFKEIARGETTIEEIWKEVEQEFDLKVPEFVKKQALK